ncbi:MAG: D-alanyl-D-alanine carboxypeptidase family protein [Bacillota bacterium]|nr:D-alanyl-D-alanine carboxypeptidase family protein [Bacillota bacterium]
MSHFIFSYGFFCFFSRGLCGTQPNLPEIKGVAAILIDEVSGRVLYEKNSHRRMSPASLTKIMTALMVLEHGCLAQKVQISQNAAETGESSIWLETGEVLSREELLYALMLNSANDAAVALAESVSKTERSFVEQMNRRARQLNLSNTHFANPHGLEDPAHYASAYDLAFLTREALAVPLFRKIVATREKFIPWPGHPWDRLLINKNRLLDRYSGALGVKTGYTKKAGNCLVGAAQRGPLRLIAVVLNSPQVYEDVESLFNYGFTEYQGVFVERKDRTQGKVRVQKGDSRFIEVRPVQDVIVALRPGEEEELDFKVTTLERVEAPVAKGDVLGYYRIYLKGKEIGGVKLVAEADVSLKPPLWSTLLARVKLFLNRVFG